MSIVGGYSYEGKSGKSVEGGPQFKQMLSDIENGKDDVDYVLDNPIYCGKLAFFCNYGIYRIFVPKIRNRRR